MEQGLVSLWQSSAPPPFTELVTEKHRQSFLVNLIVNCKVIPLPPLLPRKEKYSYVWGSYMTIWLPFMTEISDLLSVTSFIVMSALVQWKKEDSVW